MQIKKNIDDLPQCPMAIETNKSMNDLPQSLMAIKTDKSIDDLPLELLRHILLRLSAASLRLLRRVSKTWLCVISDPNFAKLHFELTAKPGRRCLLIRGSRALTLDRLFGMGKVSLECMEPSKLTILGSYGGFMLLDQCPHLITWDPTTGAHKRISYSHIGPFSKSQTFLCLDNVIFTGFGYNSSEDDYLIILAWRDKNVEEHFDFFSMRTNSWKSFEVALPNHLMHNVMQICGFFVNGSFHWLVCSDAGDTYILVFDLMARCFSKINLPKPVLRCAGHHLVEVEGCLGLALCFWSNEHKYEIWVMKEYKVQSSWTRYGTFGEGFNPIGKSNDGILVDLILSNLDFGDIVSMDTSLSNLVVSRWWVEGTPCIYKVLCHFLSTRAIYTAKNVMQNLMLQKEIELKDH